MQQRWHGHKVHLWVSRWFLFLFVGLFLSGVVPGSLVHAQDQFLDPEKAFVFSAAMASPHELQVHYAIAPDYYMYRSRFEFSGLPEGVSAGQVVFPEGKVVYDPTFDENMEVYYNTLTLRIPLPELATQPVHQQSYQLSIVSQGCADAGLCYPPRTDQLQLVADSGAYKLLGKGVKNAVPPPVQQGAGANTAINTQASQSSGVFGLGDMGLAQWLAQAGWYQVIGLSFVFGVLLTLTPCVLPMVPIVLAVVAGDTGKGGPAARWRGLRLAALYVLGMSIVYTVLGVLAGWLGASLAAWLQIPWVVGVFALVLALLALAMFDVFRFQTPAGMQTRLNTALGRLPGGRAGAAFLMGMVSALIVGPCVAAPLAGVLLFISQTADYLLGGAALFAMAWGQGLLLLVVGAGSAALLPRAGAWMEGIKRFFGLLLLATAWWMAGSLLSPVVFLLGWVFLALWAAILLGAFEPLRRSAPNTPPTLAATVLKAAGVLLGAWGLILLVGLAAGGRDALQPLAPFAAVNSTGTLARQPIQDGVVATPPAFVQVASEAELDALLANTQQAVMLDFYADWCVSCIEMERFTFTDPVVAGLMQQFLLVQADVTKNSPEHRALLKRFQLFGPPGILFFDAQGRLLPDARVVGFKNAEQFAPVLKAVLGSAKEG